MTVRVIDPRQVHTTRIAGPPLYPAGENNTILIVGDPHHGVRQDRLDTFALGFDALRASIDPAGVVCVGDATENATPEEDAVAIPWLAARGVDAVAYGNHDGTAHRPGGATDFMAAYGMPAKNYTLDLGFRLLVVISPLINGIGGTLEADTLAWLDATLTAATKKCTIMCHYPLPNSVSHYAPGGEAQIGAQDLFQIEPRGSLLTILATHSAKVAEWVCGHTHSAPDTIGLVAPYPLGDPWAALDLAAYPNLAETAAWTGYADPSATLDAYTETAGVPARLKATSGAASQRAMAFATVPVTAGDYIVFAVDLDVVVKPTLGQNVMVAWQNASSVMLQRLYSPKAAGVGQHKTAIIAQAPPGATKALVRVGNEDYSRLAAGEVSDFTINALRVCDVGSSRPAGIGQLLSVNASSPSYTGTGKTNGLATEPLPVMALTITDDNHTEIRMFDTDTQTPLLMGGTRVIRTPVPA